MKKSRLKHKIVTLITVLLLIFLFREGFLSTENPITGHSTAEIIEEQEGDIRVYFCPAENCSSYLYEAMSTAEETLYCAFFDLNLEELKELLVEKSSEIDVKLVVDDNGYDKVSELEFARKDTTSQYTHNKFCIIDSKTVTTGSMNPTFNGNYRNNNNLVVVESERLAENYEEEFSELWAGKFGKGSQVDDPVINLSGTIIKSYFCPEDWCVNKIIDELSLAEESIKFMTFSFTSEPISRKLIELHEKGISVEGVMEKQQNSKYSKFYVLNESGIDVNWDHNKHKLHHKVFIIDNDVVITGSMNPTKSGDTRNDENVLIIYSKDIAKLYLEEYKRLK